MIKTTPNMRVVFCINLIILYDHFLHPHYVIIHLNLGASHLKAETIADKTSTSRSTVMRRIKKLISLKIIKK